MLTDQMTAASDRQVPKTQTNAVLRPVGLFRDGMVLQRNRPIPMWGTAHPGRRVVCTLGKLRAAARLPVPCPRCLIMRVIAECILSVSGPMTVTVD